MTKHNRENGLTTKEVKELQLKYGLNTLPYEKKKTIFDVIIHAITEPVFLLLLFASLIYFVLGQSNDGIVMLVFVVGILSVDIFQEWKTDKTLLALKNLSSPKVTVKRNGKKEIISSTELVPGDIMYIHEGNKIAADGTIIELTELSVDESTLTGESLPVVKEIKENDTKDYWQKNYVYAGTLVISGNAVIEVKNTGINTEYGKIGQNIINVEDSIPPLEKQINKLIKICTYFAIILCFFIIIVTFINNSSEVEMKKRLIEAAISGITVAMGLIPEEFPVILTVFLSMGAWRLAKKKSLVKKLASVETLGAISVLCVDKTGTITKNEMDVQKVYPYKHSLNDLVEIMGLCCEENTYDPMEKAMLNYCHGLNITSKHLFGGKKLKDYPFTNESKMMGKAWIHDKEIILAAKGSAESILQICNLKNDEKTILKLQMKTMASSGLRIIAVAKKIYNNEKDLPNDLNDKLELCGLIGLIDPPRETIKEDIKKCLEAGIKVVMITGDNGETASSIAKKIGMENYKDILTGEQLDKLSDKELKEKVKDVTIFSRVIPEHKMRIVSAFKANGEIVAMTGDGVNDAPALKNADIGIAMGNHGSEVSREAADLILLDDNFSTIIDTIEDGRRIYDNIKRAIGYILTIHIPIALIAFLSPIMGIKPDYLLLLPIQMVLLELIIDPTSSILLERLPAEKNIMTRKPRNPNENIVNKALLFKSVSQGLILFLFSFLPYYYLIKMDVNNVLYARTIGLMIIMFGNLFLVQVNCSNYEFAFESLKKLIKDKVTWILSLIMLLSYFVILYTPLTNFLNLTSLTLKELIAVIIFSFISTYWYELIKLSKKMG